MQRYVPEVEAYIDSEGARHTGQESASEEIHQQGGRHPFLTKECFTGLMQAKEGCFSTSIDVSKVFMITTRDQCGSASHVRKKQSKFHHIALSIDQCNKLTKISSSKYGNVPMSHTRAMTRLIAE
ncbi:hypothetical protein O181_035741 [Austropuccinia psidii MF-1]|uniref:Uncharacterized protein n=1 Tax=Austropuccinia psidii MF-1 TaxID=1389203 RepID=A0A9Q3D8V0_9BASI|nr:hypothetical protein [Austropuccinia psidii MF-1]